MKKPIRSFFLVGFFLVGAMFVASTAFAAVDSYLRIEGGKGDFKKVVKCVNGACTFADLAPGEYTVVACAADGKALPPADVASHTITSPRDLATGQASGKRQHQPFRITKEWSASSPTLRIAIDEPGVQVALQCIINTSRSNIKQ